MKSKLHTWAEEVWSILLIGAAVILFLIMIFAWVVILALTVAVSLKFLLLIPLWFVDVWALDKLMKYVDGKWGVKHE